MQHQMNYRTQILFELFDVIKPSIAAKIAKVIKWFVIVK